MGAPLGEGGLVVADVAGQGAADSSVVVGEDGVASGGQGGGEWGVEVSEDACGGCDEDGWFGWGVCWWRVCGGGEWVAVAAGDVVVGGWHDAPGGWPCNVTTG